MIGLAAARDLRQRGDAVVHPRGPFPVPAQKALCRDVLTLLGFDFEAGRLDESAHPFTGGVAEDVRVTTRYVEHDFRPAVAGTIHEAGHARYAQGLPTTWRGQGKRRAAELEGAPWTRTRAYSRSGVCQPKLSLGRRREIIRMR